MNILITGSNGFLGKSFIKSYDFYNYKKFSLLENSIDSINFSKINTVLHCAALVHKKSKFTYAEYLKINCDYPLSLAKKAKEKNVKHFIFISTIAVYGFETGLLKEDTKCNPISYYGISKYKAENELIKLQDENFKVTIIRAPIINGYEAPGNMRNLIKLIVKLPILPFGKIENKRSMVYIGNLCNLINIVIKKEKKGIFLASDERSISTTDLIKEISKSLDKKTYLIKIPFFETVLKLIKPSFYKKLYGSLEVDNSLTKEILDLKNPYTIEEGIEFMINGEKV